MASRLPWACCVNAAGVPASKLATEPATEPAMDLVATAERMLRGRASASAAASESAESTKAADAPLEADRAALADIAFTAVCGAVRVWVALYCSKPYSSNAEAASSAETPFSDAKAASVSAV